MTSQFGKECKFKIFKISLDNIFDINYLDYEPVPEAKFILDSADLIAIRADNNYHVLTQLDLAGCSKRNHVCLCDKLQVTKTNLT